VPEQAGGTVRVADDVEPDDRPRLVRSDPC
jgi:hypothetical protein